MNLLKLCILALGLLVVQAQDANPAFDEVSDSCRWESSLTPALGSSSHTTIMEIDWTGVTHSGNHEWMFVLGWDVGAESWQWWGGKSIRFGKWGGKKITSSYYDLTQCNRLVTTYDSTTTDYVLYCNEDEVASIQMTSPLDITTDVTIGQANGPREEFSGCVKHVTIYRDVALTGDEITRAIDRQMATSSPTAQPTPSRGPCMPADPYSPPGAKEDCYGAFPDEQDLLAVAGPGVFSPPMETVEIAFRPMPTVVPASPGGWTTAPAIPGLGFTTVPAITFSPPCSMNTWLHDLAPWLGPPGSGVTTTDVCNNICPGRTDMSSSFTPSPWTGTVSWLGDPSYPNGVCIIATTVYASMIETTANDDCVFICQARSNTLLTHPGKDRVMMKRAVNNKIALGDDDDSATLKPWANYNSVMGDGMDDKIFIEGDHNAVDGNIGFDKLFARGSYNLLDGGDNDDDLVAEGQFNRLYGGDHRDTLHVPFPWCTNLLDGGLPSVAPGDTCGVDCMCNTCLGCMP